MPSHRRAARLRRLLGFVLAIAALTCAVTAYADPFSSYALTATFSLPSDICVFDTLSDGRLLVVSGAQVYVESAPDSHSFVLQGTLPAADISSAGAAFVRVSPSGTTISVGNNGGASFENFQVGVFAFPALTGSWFTANHFDGRWINARYLALTAGTSSGTGIVTALDTTSTNLSNPTNPTIVDDIGGASGGIAFDSAGDLFTSDGFESTGPSATGAIYAITSALWQPALTGGPPAQFETQGIPIVDLLSAAPIGFDAAGDLIVGGGNFFGSPPDDNYFAIVDASAVTAARGGAGMISGSNTAAVRKLDPAPGTNNDYYTGVNLVRSELYASPLI